MVKIAFKNRLLSILLTFGLLIGVAFCIPVQSYAAAGELYVIGGAGGEGAVGFGTGGQGGAVVDGAFWASGGGGGSSCDSIGSANGLIGNKGTDGAEGVGGYGGSFPYADFGMIGGNGGNGNNSSSEVNTGSGNTGQNGGAGGGYINETYANGTYTAAGGGGGNVNNTGGNGGSAELSIAGGTYTTVAVTSGAPGDGGRSNGAGGSAALSVSGTLTAATITVTKPLEGGAASASIGTLLVAGGGTTLTNDGGEVNIDTIKFDTASTSLSTTGTVGVTNIKLVPPATSNGGTTGFSLTGITSGTLSIDTSNLSLSGGESITLLSMVDDGVPEAWGNQIFGDYKTVVRGTSLMLQNTNPAPTPAPTPTPEEGAASSGGSPQTGDNSPIFLWITLGCFALLGIIFIIRKRRRAEQ